MSIRQRPATTSGMPGPGKRRGQGIDEVSRVALSKRIWAVLGGLTILLIITSAGMFMARGELESVRSALRQAETRVNEAELRLKDALVDKQQVIREITAQGNRIAESTLGEEKARSALSALSSDAKAAEKRVGDLKARLAKSQKQLRALRKENAALSTVKAELAVLTDELDETRARLEQTGAEMERFRALAEPYSARPQGTWQPGQ